MFLCFEPEEGSVASSSISYRLYQEMQCRWVVAQVELSILLRPADLFIGKLEFMIQ